MKGDNRHWLGGASSPQGFADEGVPLSLASEARRAPGETLRARIGEWLRLITISNSSEESFNPMAQSDPESFYRCRNCGKRMTLQDAVNYYGIPACPACVNAGAPFEIVPELPPAASGERKPPEEML